MKRSWFRVLVDASGKVVDCKPVAGEGTEAGGVFFVLAASAAAAAKAANNRHCAALLRARRARYAAEGLCKCGRARDTPGMLTCSGCRARHKIHDERKAARDRGEEVPPLDRRTVLLERKQSELSGARMAALIEVQNMYTRLRAKPEAFERWLAGQLEAARGKKVA